MTHTNTIKKAAGASNTNGLHTDTNTSNFPTAEKKSQVFAKQIALVLAQTGHHVIEGDRGDFTVVCKGRSAVHGLTRYCTDFAALQSFSTKLGVNHG